MHFVFFNSKPFLAEAVEEQAFDLNKVFFFKRNRNVFSDGEKKRSWISQGGENAALPKPHPLGPFNSRGLKFT